MHRTADSLCATVVAFPSQQLNFTLLALHSIRLAMPDAYAVHNLFSTFLFRFFIFCFARRLLFCISHFSECDCCCYSCFAVEQQNTKYTLEQMCNIGQYSLSRLDNNCAFTLFAAAEGRRWNGAQNTQPNEKMHRMHDVQWMLCSNVGCSDRNVNERRSNKGSHYVFCIHAKVRSFVFFSFDIFHSQNVHWSVRRRQIQLAEMKAFDL